MNLPTRSLVFCLAYLLAGCAGLPHPKGERNDAPGADASYVPESELSARSHHDGLDVITSIQLHHVTATAAEQHLQSRLPEDVLVGITGNTQSILLQGPGPGVYDAAETLKRFDASKGLDK